MGHALRPRYLIEILTSGTFGASCLRRTNDGADVVLSLSVRIKQRTLTAYFGQISPRKWRSVRESDPANSQRMMHLPS